MNKLNVISNLISMSTKPPMGNLVPMVIEESGRGERSFDIFSLLLRQRIIFVNGEIHDGMASLIIAQLLFLEAENPNADITLYINSPGGHIHSGMAIFDTMNLIKCDVSTVGMGMCASMGSFLLAGGTKGKRITLPNTKVMIHQPLGGAQGQASDMEIQWKEMEKTKKKMNEYLAEFTGKDYKTLVKDTDRDYYMTAEEAVEYGLVDEICNNN